MKSETAHVGQRIGHRISNSKIAGSTPAVSTNFMKTLTRTCQSVPEGRRRMKAVMKVWTGDAPIGVVAKNFKTTRKELEAWCRAAMKGAKWELARCAIKQ